MAGLPWFKVFSNIVGHPKTRALEEATGNPEALAYIVRLMSWFNEYAPSGRADGARTARAIERACEWNGEPGVLIAALESCGWLDHDGAELRLHDWDDVQGSHIAKASKDAEAKKLKRLQAKEAKLSAIPALKRRDSGAEAARAETADGADAARLEERRGEESRDLSATQRPADAIPERPDLVLTAQKPRKPPRKHREPTHAETLYKDLQESRQERCVEVGAPFISDSWDFARQNDRLKPLCGLPPEEGERLTRAWGLYLADDENRAREPPWSLAYFLSPGVRSKYETRAAREAV